jgi:hypothetical protein
LLQLERQEGQQRSDRGWIVRGRFGQREPLQELDQLLSFSLQKAENAFDLVIRHIRKTDRPQAATDDR